MTIKFAKSKALPIGIDFGSSMLKMAQLRCSDDEIELLAVASCEMPPVNQDDPIKCSDLMVEALREKLRNNPFKGHRCILSLPTRATFVQHVKVPNLPSHEIQNAVRWELQNKLPFPLDEAIIRHIVAGRIHGENEAKQEVIAVATSRSILENYLSIAHQAKLDVIGVNIAPFAVVECFARLFRRSSDTVRTIMFADIGAASTHVVLSHGPQIVFARNIPTAGRDMDEAVAKGLQVPIQQASAVRRDLLKGNKDEATADELYHLLDGPVLALTEQLTQCLRYYESVFHNQTIERAIFVGGQALDKRLCQSIAKRLNLPAQIGDPLLRIKRIDGAGLEFGLDRREPQPHWSVAVGLSLGATRAA